MVKVKGGQSDTSPWMLFQL